MFLPKNVERQNLPFGRARKAYILKFRHIELAIGREVHSKTMYLNTLIKRSKVKLVKYKY